MHLIWGKVHALQLHLLPTAVQIVLTQKWKIVKIVKLANLQPCNQSSPLHCGPTMFLGSFFTLTSKTQYFCFISKKSRYSYFPSFPMWILRNQWILANLSLHCPPHPLTHPLSQYLYQVFSIFAPRPPSNLYRGNICWKYFSSCLWEHCVAFVKVRFEPIW